MTSSHSDALVFFGATGDLAYKKIFPALQAMAKRGHLGVPVIGVAKAGAGPSRATCLLSRHSAGPVWAGCGTIGKIGVHQWRPRYY